MRISRRDFISATAVTAASAIVLLYLASGCQQNQKRQKIAVDQYQPEAAGVFERREFLSSLVPTREHVTNFIRGADWPERLSRNDGWMFDAELGWVLSDAVRELSVDGSKGFYHYEEDGARKVVQFSDRPCRIHTYGDSFTHCDQVSDGETWQEYLAGHLQEPIRNYGAGGYSVYQAYLRMLKAEAESPAEYIILNIWDDDHYRNLDAWRPIRFGRVISDNFTLPHLRVDVEAGFCQQLPNIFSKADEVYQLCDQEYVWKMFADDLVLKLHLASRKKRGVSAEQVREIAGRFGVSAEGLSNMAPQDQLREIYTAAALFSTKNVVTWTEQFCKRTGKKLMIILSFSQGNVAAYLRGERRFDQSFVDWLVDKPYRVIDLRDAYRQEYKQFGGDVDEYLQRYFIGHHNPAGNFFMAWAIKNQVVEWLSPKPLPYR